MNKKLFLLALLAVPGCAPRPEPIVAPRPAPVHTDINLTGRWAVVEEKADGYEGQWHLQMNGDDWWRDTVTGDRIYIDPGPPRRLAWHTTDRLRPAITFTILEAKDGQLEFISKDGFRFVATRLGKGK